MAIAWLFEDGREPIAFSEMIEYFDGLGADVLKTDLDQSAAVLGRLYNNRTFLVDVLAAQLEDLPSFERMNGYTSQVFVLHRSEHYFVRAAIWLPRTHASHDEMFLYEDAHDHNFNLLTLGYLGNGYRTVLFEYDRDSVVGYVGEDVPVTFLENTGLTERKVMLFREGKDIHVQFPPEDFSISINVISTGGRKCAQYAFDLDLDPRTARAKIRKSMVGHMPVGFVRFARSMGVDDVSGKLEAMLSETLSSGARRAVLDGLQDPG